MPRRKTTLSDVLPPAPNQAEETSSDNVKTNERPSKRRKTSGSVTDNGSGASSGSMDLDKKTRQTRSSTGNVQPTSKKASILSRAATSTSPAPPPLLPPTPATSTAVVTEAILSHLGQATLPGATTLTITEHPVEQDVINVSQGQLVQIETLPPPPPLVRGPSASDSQPSVQHQLVTIHHHDGQNQRAQSSSAPPALVTVPEQEVKGGQIRDRRSTRSLEALFKVTDSELQNMREDTPTHQTPVTIAVDHTQNFIVLKDVQLVDQDEGTQLIIAPSNISYDGASDEGFYTISTIPSSTSEQTSFTFTHANEDSAEGIKLVLKNATHSDVQDYQTITTQPQSYSVITETAEKEVSIAAKPAASTPGRKSIHPQKPGKYQCKYCDRTCAKPSVLEKHIRAHTNERPFPCVVCGVSFKTKSNLSKHCKSIAHGSRTGLSLSGAKESSLESSKEEEAKSDDNDSEGTDTDVEGATIDHDDESNGENPKVIVENTESANAEVDLHNRTEHHRPDQMVRQESVLEGIRQKIDKNKRQQLLQHEGEGKRELSNWFSRVFCAFDKPSDSELAKYDVAESVVRPNILTTDNISNGEEILAGLQELKKKYSQLYPSSLPVLMTHHFQTDNEMLVKILVPKAEYVTEKLKFGLTTTTVAGQQLMSDTNCSGCVMSLSPNLSHPSPSLVSSSTPVLQSKLSFKEHSELETSEAKYRSQLASHSSDHSADRLSFDSPSRPKLLSHRSDISASSMRSIFSQSSTVSSLSSVDESSTRGSRQFSLEGEGTKVSVPTSTRHPALGDSKTAAFSTICPQNEKPTLVYQHALDSDSDKMLKYQGRSLSSSVTPDMLKDRIENIISSNAEIIDKHSLTDPPRPRNKYLRQTSDSSFQTLKMSDFKPSSETSMDRLTVEPNTDKQWKKKLAASLSLGDSDGGKLKPDFVKRSMSTSALKKAESIAEGNNQPTLIVTTGSTNNLHLASVIQNISAPQYGEVVVLHPDQQYQQIQLHQACSDASQTHKSSQESSGENTNTLISQSFPVNFISKSATGVGSLTQFQTQMFSSVPIDALNNIQVPLSNAQLICVPVTTLSKQSLPGDQKTKPDDYENLMKKSTPQSLGNVYKHMSIPEVRSVPPLLSETPKSFSVSSSLSSGSLSGARVTIQDSQGNTGLMPAVSAGPAVPSLPTKIVPGPGPHEIQIQIKLPKNASHQSLSHIQQAAITLPVTKTSTETPQSIISSMLQAPRQPSPMIGQPSVQFPKAGSPLLTSKSFSDSSTVNKLTTTPLVQTGSLDLTNPDASAAGRFKIGTSGSLHDQKKSMSRQGVTSTPAQVKQASFMTELQHRLSVPQSDVSLDWKKKSGILGRTDNDNLAILTTEHFKSQGLSDGLAAAAGAYVMNGPFPCDDCNEVFTQYSLLTQHKAQACPKTKGLRRSLSAMEPSLSQTGDQHETKSPSELETSSGLLIVRDPHLLKKANPALFKSLSTTDLQTGQLANKDLPKLREQLILASSASLIMTTNQSLSTLSPSVLTVASSDKQLIHQQTISTENTSPLLPRKKGRPKGSKNRPKDLNLVLAKARGAQIGSQALLPGMRHNSSLDLPSQKDTSLSANQGSLLLVPGGQYQKLLLPRSLSQNVPITGEVSSGATVPVTSTTVSSISTSSMIGQPMVPGAAGHKPTRQLSSGISTTTNLLTPASKAGLPILGLSTGVTLPGLTFAGTSTVSVLTPGTPINTLAPNTPIPGTPKSSGFMISFPVSSLPTPGTPITPITPTIPLTGKTVRTQSLDSNAFVPGPTKLASGSGLTLNITSAQSVNSAQFAQTSPRVIPYIPAVTFHNVDPNMKLSISSPMPDQKSQPQFRLSQPPQLTLSLTAPSTPGTPLTPATPDTPADLSGTRRKLKDKLLLKQSLSVERGQDRSQEKSMSVDPPLSGFLLKAHGDSPSIIHQQPTLFPPASKPHLPASNNSVLLASLTKPVVSSQKLGSLPNAVITSAVMGKHKEPEKAPEAFFRSESETLVNMETVKIHPPVMRAFSEPSAAVRIKKSKQHKPSPLSIEEKDSSASGSRMISKMLSSSKSVSSLGPEEMKKSWVMQTKTESMSESFDSGLSVRSMSQETPFFFPKSASIASLDSNELMIDLSGDNFNNVTIPINYAIPFVSVNRLESGPLLSEWNHGSKLTGSLVNLSPLTLAGSKIILPAVGGTAMLQREAKNWLLKRSISLHRHFQILSRLWHSSSPVTLDSMTAMALAQGNPSPALLGRALLSYSSSSSSFSETPSTGTPGSADPAKLKSPPSYPLPQDSKDDLPPATPSTTERSDSVTSDKSLSTPPVHLDKPSLASPAQLRARLLSSPSKGSQEISSDEPHATSRPLFTPVKSAAAAFGISLSTPSSLLSSVEQHLTNVTPSGTLNTPMYGHSCPTLYTTTHVTFCCIQRPQPMYVAVKGSKKISMYSNWRLATHNPNPVGLTSRMLLALYKSSPRSGSNPVFAQCSMTPSNGGNQTHSSYWTYQKKKMGMVKKELSAHVKSEDSKSGIKLEHGSSKESKRHKLRLTKGGFKSDENYEYIRGRGWGKYICELCGIRCKKPSMLKKHLRTHTDLRPYHCRHCHFSFKTKGNLTKHMKSKSHQKKCYELGIIPVPTSVDESQIDSAALEEQCRISREAHIHDSADRQNHSGDEDDDDAEGDDDDDDEDDEEDEGMSRDDMEDQSFDQEKSGSSSPRVLKRQSSVDEASPVFSFGHGQRSRQSLGQLGAKSRNREFSESSNVSYSSQSSMENRAMSPHNIDTEIARSLLDLSQPRRSESKEIVDEDARRHALSNLQSLISQLMAQKKPLSGLNLSGDNPTFKSSQEQSSRPLSPTPGTSHDEMRGQSSDLTHLLTRHEDQRPETSGARFFPHRKSGSEERDQTHKRMSELYVFTEDKGDRRGEDTTDPHPSRDQDPVERRMLQISESSLSPSKPLASPSLASRPNQLSLLKSPASPSKLHLSNLPSPSLVSFLPAYVSSRYAQRGRMSKLPDQGPIIGQFVRKENQSVNTPNVAFTPNLVLAGQSQPFQFNIPFPGTNLSTSSSFDNDGQITPSPVVTTAKSFVPTIPIVTITDTSCDSPTIESYDVYTPRSTPASPKTTVVSAPPPTDGHQILTGTSSDLNKTTSTMSSSPLSSGSSSMKAPAVIKASIRPTLESQGRSNSESATTSPVCRDSAIGSLIRESAMPILLVTGTEYSGKNSGLETQASSPSPNSQSDSCIDAVNYPAAKRSRRLSSGKSRFLRRQRSLADDTAFPACDMDSVFDTNKSASMADIQSSKHTEQTDNRENKNSELTKSKSFQGLSTIEENSILRSEEAKGSSEVNKQPGAEGSHPHIPEKDPEVEKPKSSSCAFCSEFFSSSESYYLHLRSRKHIGVLESLGMLPAGTFEKLQQSEMQESHRQKEEQGKQDSEVKVETEESKKLEGSAREESGKMHDSTREESRKPDSSGREEQRKPDDSSRVEEQMEQVLETAHPSDLKEEVTPADVVEPTESPLYRRSCSLQDSIQHTGAAGVSRFQRTPYKRKFSHQPVTESATVLATPHLNENLRQSLAKRAKYGLTQPAVGRETDKESEGHLVIDEKLEEISTSSGITALSGVTIPSGVTVPPKVSVPSGVTGQIGMSGHSGVMGQSGIPASSGISQPGISSTPGVLVPSSTSSHSEISKGILDLLKPISTVVSLLNSKPVQELTIPAKETPPAVSRGFSMPSYIDPPDYKTSGMVSQTSLDISATMTARQSDEGVGNLLTQQRPASTSTGGSTTSSFSSKLVDGAMLHQCMLCDLTFTNTNLLKTHLVNHAELRPHVCEYCDAGFTNSQSLRTHLLTHGQDRPYICGNCGDTFAQLADLQSHYSSHSSTSIRQNIQADLKMQSSGQSTVQASGRQEYIMTASLQSSTNTAVSHNDKTSVPTSSSLSASYPHVDISSSINQPYLINPHLGSEKMNLTLENPEPKMQYKLQLNRANKQFQAGEELSPGQPLDRSFVSQEFMDNNNRSLGKLEEKMEYEETTQGSDNLSQFSLDSKMYGSVDKVQGSNEQMSSEKVMGWNKDDPQQWGQRRLSPNPYQHGQIQGLTNVQSNIGLNNNVMMMSQVIDPGNMNLSPRTSRLENIKSSSSFSSTSDSPKWNQFSGSLFSHRSASQSDSVHHVYRPDEAPGNSSQMLTGNNPLVVDDNGNSGDRHEHMEAQSSYDTSHRGEEEEGAQKTPDPLLLPQTYYGM